MKASVLEAYNFIYILKIVNKGLTSKGTFNLLSDFNSK